MSILAIDPGTTRSAWVHLSASGTVVEHGIEPNDVVRDRVCNARAMGMTILVEMLESYGMRFVGAETWDTAVWIGRFVEASGGTVILRPHSDVKLHLLGARRGKDPDVIAALRDRYGGAGCKGTKAAPGPLYGIHADEWQALALAVTFLDERRAAA